MNHDRVPALDGVRGIAIIAVMGLHAGQMAPALDARLASLVWIASYGNTGVDLFFVLSGFLITGGLLDSRAQEGYFRRFYWRRALRILPLYYGILATTVIVTGGLGGSAPWFWLHLANWVRVSHPHVQLPASLAVTWSLGIEEQFYAVWPLVVLALSPRAILRSCIVIVIAEPVLRAIAILGGMPLVSIWAATPLRLDGLAAGAAIAVMIRQPAGLTSLSHWARPAFLAASIVAVLSTLPSHAYTLAPPVVVIGYSAAGVASAALVVVAACQARAAELLSWGILRLFGRLSYALYLFHLPLLYWSVRFGWLGFATWAPLSLGAAWLSWRYVESPLLMLKNWKPRVRGVAAATGEA